MYDQLEIIRVNGDIEFYTLDPAKGITNIGSHPENDIVITGPGVALFHAMLDHRQKPYQLVVLSQEGQIRLGQQPLPPNVTAALQDWDHIELDGHTLILVAGSATAPGPGAVPASGMGPTRPAPGLAPSTATPGLIPSFPTPGMAPPAPPALPAGSAPAPFFPPGPALPSRPALIAAPTTRPESLRPPAPGPAPVPTAPVPFRPWATYTARPQDQTDEVIVVEMPVRDGVVDVEQTATFELEVINGGDIVAMFGVSVEGVNPAWIDISQPFVNLNEGDRAKLVVTITPPRQPTSRAGAHHLAFVVTSPNYPGRICRLGGTLTVNPYFEFAVGELSPRQQSISWFKRAGQVTLPVINRGNSPAVFQVDGADDERSCSFEFQVPGEAVNLARQAELHLHPSENLSLPVMVTPHSRQLVGLRRRNHAFTLTTSLLGGGQTPRSVLGQLRHAPLLGPFHLLLLLLVLVFLIVIIFRPYIRTFNADGSISKAITAGQAVTLNWNASPFSRLTIPELGPAPLDSPQGKVTAVPTANITYELRADNWLSRLSPWLFSVEPRRVSVMVTPIPPEIQIFDGDRKDILSGDSVNLSWLVKNADTVVLVNQDDGSIKPLSGVSGNLDTGPLDREVTYVLEASNVYIATPVRSDPLRVRVSTPTPTPRPTPMIVRFFANPSVIVAGESTTLEWEVTGTDQVSIQGLGPGAGVVLPASHRIDASPQQTTEYVLTAANGPAAAGPQTAKVFVTPAPTATPVPDAPEIVFFEASATELIQGKATPEEDEKQVTLRWLIRGDVTRVELNGGADIGVLSNLAFPEGSLTVNLAKNALFVLTAFNQDKAASKTLQVEVLQATPTTTPAPTGTPLPTATATPTPPVIFFLKVEPISAADASKVTLVDPAQNLYSVEVGTDIKLTWQVSSDANEVTLNPLNLNFGPGPNFFEIQDYSAQSPPNFPEYRLYAKNSATPIQPEKVVYIQVKAKNLPNPPGSLTGTRNGADNTVSWTWIGSTADIAGFRIYRADVPPGSNFTAVHEAGPDPPYTWTDSGAGCGKVYYVVTLYFDTNLKKVETQASGTSWSSPCP